MVLACVPSRSEDLPGRPGDLPCRPEDLPGRPEDLFSIGLGYVLSWFGKVWYGFGMDLAWLAGCFGR